MQMMEGMHLLVVVRRRKVSRGRGRGRGRGEGRGEGKKKVEKNRREGSVSANGSMWYSYR